MKTRGHKNKLAEQAGGHKDIAYGMFDRPGPQNEEDQDTEDFTMMDIVAPIVPSEMVATQLAVEKPPIDDPDYVPSNIQTLSAAVGELSKTVPVNKIHKFYIRIQDLIEKLVTEEAEEVEEDEMAGEEMTETNLRRMVSKLIKEAVPAKGVPDSELKRWKQEFDSEFGPDPDDDFDVEGGAEETDDEKAAYAELEPNAAPDSQLSTLADMLGFAGPSGAKNFLYKLTQRVKTFSSIPDEEFDAMIKFVAGEYVDLLNDSNMIDAEDVEFMYKHVAEVSKLPSFKFFLFHAFILPAANTIIKTSADKTYKMLDKLGVPKKVQGSVVNQLSGGVPKNEPLLRKRLEADPSLTPTEAAALADKLFSQFEALQSLAQGADDFVEVALQKYSKINKAKLMQILHQASEDPDVNNMSAA